MDLNAKLINSIVTEDVQRYYRKVLLDKSKPYTPLKTGALIRSGRVTNTGISYDAPHAKNMYMGIIMVNQRTGYAGFPNIDGGVTGYRGKRIPATLSNRRKHIYPTYYTYIGGPTRGSHWVQRAYTIHKDDIIEKVKAYMERG